jgi:hypothetical protein
LADLTGDGRPDIVGFGNDYIWAALGNGDGTFQPPVPAFPDLVYNKDWRIDQHPRLLADLTGDGRADIVGFGGDGVYAALGDGAGGFQLAAGIAGFSYDQGWRVDQHPRFLADLTGDGRADIVGFGGDGVYAALSDGAGGFQLAAGLGDLGYDQGWLADRYLRLVADLTGDGRADLVGFGDDYVWSALGNGDGSFQSPGVGAKAFGYNDGWRVDQHPRLLADLTGDGRADIVGFGNEGVWTALGLGNGSFHPSTATLALEDFGAQSGNKGVLPVKRAVISLDHLHCHKDGEIGGGEPYLLVAFFKVDGENNFIGVHEDTDSNGVLVRHLAILGSCTFRATLATHSNLGDTSVNDGDNVPIPPQLGRVEFELKPITPPDAPDVAFVGGFCGVIVALMEQNSTSGEAIEAGHRAFDRTLRRLINEIVPTLQQDMADPLPPSKLEELMDEVAHRVKAAVFSAEFRSIIGIPNLFNADDLIGADVFIADHSREIHARFQRILPGVPPANQQVLKQDYELFGSMTVEVTDA